MRLVESHTHQRVRVPPRAVLCAVVCTAVVAACGKPEPAVPFSAEEVRKVMQHSPLPAPQQDRTNAVADAAAAARLGQFLFFDQRLSSTGTIACATCHRPERGWVDPQPLSHAIGVTKRHVPTLFNTAFNRWFFWDGRADSHWAQALQPLEDANEHGGSRLQYAHLISGDPQLRAAYEKIFGSLPDLSDQRRFPPAGRPVPDQPDHPHQVAWDSMTPEDQRTVNQVFSNLGKTIAAYERRIISRNAPFDVFVEGLRDHDAIKLAALSASAQRGLKLFIGKANCRQCHSGSNFTDGEFHMIGLPPQDGQVVDLGRHAGVTRVLNDPFNGIGIFSDDRDLTGREALKFLKLQQESYGQFKVPTLRNVAETAPYMHDGRFATLEEVVRFYSTQAGTLDLGHHQETILRPLNLTDGEMADLIAFLQSLTGQAVDPALMRQPPSPAE